MINIQENKNHSLKISGGKRLIKKRCFIADVSGPDPFSTQISWYDYADLEYLYKVGTIWGLCRPIDLYRPTSTSVSMIWSV